MSEFLKNLQDNLDKGEKDQTYKERMDEILKRADKMSDDNPLLPNKASELEKTKENTPSVTEEEAEKANVEYERKMEQIDIEQSIEVIEGIKNEIAKTKFERDKIRETLLDLQTQLNNSIDKFEDKHGRYEDYIPN